MSDPLTRMKMEEHEHGRLNALKADIHTKGTLLSATWNDLYRLLSQYQAELFVSEPQNNSEGQLRRDLNEKDALLAQLQHKLNLAETENERIRLDLTVKNSLLQKYQDDLLDKESALLTCQATIRKLENKHRLLETKMNGTEGIPVSVETIEHAQARGRPGRGSLINASISAISQKRKASLSQTPNKRKSTTPSQNPPKSENKSLEQIVNNLSQNDQNDNLPTTVIKDEVLEPGELDQDQARTEPAVFPEPVEAPDPAENMEKFENWQNAALAEATGEIVTSNKRSPRFGYACDLCGRVFSRNDHRNRHVESVHLRLKKYQCSRCLKAFTRKDHLHAHEIMVKCKIHRYSALGSEEDDLDLSGTGDPLNTSENNNEEFTDQNVTEQASYASENSDIRMEGIVCFPEPILQQTNDIPLQS